MTAALPTLSVVIPVFDEPDWIQRTVADAERAIERSGFAEPEILVVDDGSAEPTRRVLDALRDAGRIRLVRQANSGRFEARRTGVGAASGDLVLLLDARVSLDAESLRFVGERWSEDRPAWNGHCTIEKTGNPYARFWDVLTVAAFRDYFLEPRTASFGLEDYDRYPKGTGHFLAPRSWLLDAIGGFDSHYEDSRFASDDTHMLRAIAARRNISISPGFASVYHSRTDLRRFLRHAFHRGTTFFDGFAHRDSRFFPVLAGVFPATAVAAAVAVRRPAVAAALLVGTAPTAGTLARSALRRSWRDSLAFGVLAPCFGVVYVAGIWRGAILAARGRWRA